MKLNLRHHCHPERGYALLFILFLVALVIIGGSVALMNQLTEGERQRESEMIWRGKQYQRAIGLYYRKFGRFPTSIRNLVKGENNIRFLRQAYKDPMTKDGSWRLIYVLPTGQLIGSVRYTSLQEMAFLDQQRKMGIAGGSGAGALVGATGAAGDNSGTQPPAIGGPVSPGNSLGQPPLPGQPQGQPPGQSGLPNTSPAGPGVPGSQPVQPFFTQGLQLQAGANSGIGVSESSGSSGQVIGGFIIGVAGKLNKPSIKIYKGGTTYKQWEFIFNPLEQVQTIGGISTGPAAPAGAQPGSGSPLGMPQPPPQPPRIPQQ